MLFLGLGTGLGSATKADGVLTPMELGHLPHRKGKTAGLRRHGKKKWKRSVDDIVKRLIAALEPDYIVLGGGNADKLAKPPHCARVETMATRSKGDSGFGGTARSSLLAPVEKEHHERTGPCGECQRTG